MFPFRAVTGDVHVGSSKNHPDTEGFVLLPSSMWSSCPAMRCNLNCNYIVALAVVEQGGEKLKRMDDSMND